MPLTGTQERAFTQTFDLYIPNLNQVRTGVSRATGLVRHQLKTQNVKGRIMSTPDSGTPTPHGRTNEDYLDTTDRLRLPEGTQIEDGWVVYEQGEGGWYAVMGGPKRLRFRASTIWVYVKRIEASPSIVEPGDPDYQVYTP